MHRLKNIFSEHGPWLFILLIGPIGWSLCAWLNADPESSDLQLVSRWGAASQSLVFQEPWRVVSASLLNLSPTHLLLNTTALIVMGVLAFPLFGLHQLWNIAWLSAWFGTIVALFQPGFVLGSSAAAFGILGAVLAFLPKRIPSDKHKILWITMGLTLAVLLLAPGDLWAHGGGLAAGALLGRKSQSMDDLEDPEFRTRRRLSAAIAVIQATACLLILTHTC